MHSQRIHHQRTKVFLTTYSLGLLMSLHRPYITIFLWPIQCIALVSIPAIVDYDQRGVPLPRRQSSTVIDLTGEFPRLVRRGNLSIAELRSHLRRVGLRQLQIEDYAQQI